MNATMTAGIAGGVLPGIRFANRRLAGWLSTLLVCSMCHAAAASSEIRPEPVYGAGPSTRIVTLFFDAFSSHPTSSALNLRFIVPQRSTKHLGGIRASGEHLFGRTGRPLGKEEKALGKIEIPLGKIPVGFATGTEVSLPPLAPRMIDRLFSGQVRNWKEVGGPNAAVVLVGREKTEATLGTLSKQFPILMNADYDIVLRRDHAVVNYLSSAAGRHAIGFGALSNFDGLNIVTLNGLTLGVDVGLVVDLKNRNHAVVEAVRRYANSAEWRSKSEEAGYIPITRADGPSIAGATADGSVR